VVLDRDALQLGAVGPSADGAEQPVPAPVRLQQLDLGAVPRLERGALAGFVEAIARLHPVLLRRLAEEPAYARPPIGQALVDLEPHLLRDAGPGIALGRVEPLAAQIGGQAKRSLDGVGTPAEPVPCLQNDHIEPRGDQATPGPDARGAGAHHHDVALA